MVGVIDAVLAQLAAVSLLELPGTGKLDPPRPVALVFDQSRCMQAYALEQDGLTLLATQPLQAYACLAVVAHQAALLLQPLKEKSRFCLVPICASAQHSPPSPVALADGFSPADRADFESKSWTSVYSFDSDRGVILASHSGDVAVVDLLALQAVRFISDFWAGRRNYHKKVVCSQTASLLIGGYIIGQEFFFILHAESNRNRLVKLSHIIKDSSISNLEDCIEVIDFEILGLFGTFYLIVLGRTEQHKQIILILRIDEDSLSLKLELTSEICQSFSMDGSLKIKRCPDLEGWFWVGGSQFLVPFVINREANMSNESNQWSIKLESKSELLESTEVSLSSSIWQEQSLIAFFPMKNRQLFAVNGQSIVKIKLLSIGEPIDSIEKPKNGRALFELECGTPKDADQKQRVPQINLQLDKVRLPYGNLGSLEYSRTQYHRTQTHPSMQPTQTQRSIASMSNEEINIIEFENSRFSCASELVADLDSPQKLAVPLQNILEQAQQPVLQEHSSASNLARSDYIGESLPEELDRKYREHLQSSHPWMAESSGAGQPSDSGPGLRQSLASLELSPDRPSLFAAPATAHASNPNTCSIMGQSQANKNIRASNYQSTQGRDARASGSGAKQDTRQGYEPQIYASKTREIVSDSFLTAKQSINRLYSCQAPSDLVIFGGLKTGLMKVIPGQGKVKLNEKILNYSILEGVISYQNSLNLVSQAAVITLNPATLSPISVVQREPPLFACEIGNSLDRGSSLPDLPVAFVKVAPHIDTPIVAWIDNYETLCLITPGKSDKAPVQKICLIKPQAQREILQETGITPKSSPRIGNYIPINGLILSSDWSIFSIKYIPDSASQPKETFDGYVPDEGLIIAFHGRGKPETRESIIKEYRLDLLSESGNFGVIQCARSITSVLVSRCTLKRY